MREGEPRPHLCAAQRRGGAVGTKWAGLTAFFPRVARIVCTKTLKSALVVARRCTCRRTSSPARCRGFTSSLFFFFNLRMRQWSFRSVASTRQLIDNHEEGEVAFSGSKEPVSFRQQLSNQGDGWVAGTVCRAPSVVTERTRSRQNDTTFVLDVDQEP